MTVLDWTDRLTDCRTGRLERALLQGGVRRVSIVRVHH
eukprot:SAG22_NODE_2916_length_2107_cov_1.378984_1_plen_37_part_10